MNFPIGVMSETRVDKNNQTGLSVPHNHASTYPQTNFHASQIFTHTDP